MKNVLLSADGDSTVYSVPDEVADNLKKYCLIFIDWLRMSSDAKQFRQGGSLCYCEKDFIDYLNKWVFPTKRSTFVENLGWVNFESDLPAQYRNCQSFNF